MSRLRAHRHERDFTILGNPTLRDQRLSFRARGLLSFLLSQPDNYPVNAAKLAEEAPEGRDAIVTALRELEATGYLERRREQDERGRWQTFTDVYETPELAGTDTGFSGVGERRRSEHITAGRTDDGSADFGEPGPKSEGLRAKDGKELPPTAALIPHRLSSRDLLGEHLDALGHDLATKGQLAATIKRLLDRVGVPADEIRAALAAMRDRGLTSPNVLPALVDEVRGGGRRTQRPVRYALNGDHVTPPAQLQQWAARRRAEREQEQALPELEARP